MLEGVRMKINVKSIRKERGIIAVTSFILLLAQVAKTMGGTAALYISFGLVMLISLLLPLEKLLFFSLAILPLNRLLYIGAITAPVGVMLIATVRFFLLRRIRLRKPFILVFLMLLLYGALSAVWGESNFLSVAKMGFILLFFLLEMELNSVREENIYEKCVMYLSFGCVLSTVLALMMDRASLQEDVVRFSASVTGSQNILGILNAICCLHCYYLATRSRSRGFNRIILNLLLLGTGLSGFITGSRSFVLAIAVGLICFLLTDLIKARISIIVKVGLGILVIGVAGYLFYSKTATVNNIVDSFLHRFNKLAKTDISNGRFGIWREYIELFKANPKYLWLGNMEYAEVGIRTVAHNMILEQIASYGIIGSLFIITAYFFTAKEMKYQSGLSRRRKDFTAFIPTLAFLVASLFSHTLLGVTQTTLLFLGYIALFSKKTFA